MKVSLHQCHYVIRCSQNLSLRHRSIAPISSISPTLTLEHSQTATSSSTSQLFLTPRQHRSLHSSAHSQGKQVTHPIDLPSPPGSPKVYPPHIQQIVTSIGKLTLVEVADLNELLKTQLKIADAPMMPMGGMPMMTAPAAAQEEEEAEEVVVQTEFKVVLKSYDEKSKIKLIKEVKKLLPDLNLVQAKKFVEEVPKTIKEAADKEDAEAIKTALSAVDGVVEIS